MPPSHRLSHQAPGWTLHALPDGGLRWTTPAGQVLTTYPPDHGARTSDLPADSAPTDSAPADSPPPEFPSAPDPSDDPPPF